MRLGLPREGRGQVPSDASCACLSKKSDRNIRELLGVVAAGRGKAVYDFIEARGVFKEGIVQ